MSEKDVFLYAKWEKYLWPKERVWKILLNRWKILSGWNRIKSIKISQEFKEKEENTTC